MLIIRVQTVAGPELEDINQLQVENDFQADKFQVHSTTTIATRAVDVGRIATDPGTASCHGVQNAFKFCLTRFWSHTTRFSWRWGQVNWWKLDKQYVLQATKITTFNIKWYSLTFRSICVRADQLSWSTTADFCRANCQTHQAEASYAGPGCRNFRSPNPVWS